MKTSKHNQNFRSTEYNLNMTIFKNQNVPYNSTKKFITRTCKYKYKKNINIKHHLKLDGDTKKTTIRKSVKHTQSIRKSSDTLSSRRRSTTLRAFLSNSNFSLNFSFNSSLLKQDKIIICQKILITLFHLFKN